MVFRTRDSNCCSRWLKKAAQGKDSCNGDNSCVKYFGTLLVEHVVDEIERIENTPSMRTLDIPDRVGMDCSLVGSIDRICVSEQ